MHRRLAACLALDSLETKLHQRGMLEHSTVGAEELEHRIEDHLPDGQKPARVGTPDGRAERR